MGYDEKVGNLLTDYPKYVVGPQKDYRRRNGRKNGRFCAHGTKKYVKPTTDDNRVTGISGFSNPACVKSKTKIEQTVYSINDGVVPEYIRARALGAKLSINPRTVLKWAKQGLLKPRRLTSRCVLFSVEEVRQIMEGKQ